MKATEKLLTCDLLWLNVVLQITKQPKPKTYNICLFCIVCCQNKTALSTSLKETVDEFMMYIRSMNYTSV